LYFPMKVAVTRMGGLAETARKLGISDKTVSGWIATTRRARPSDAVLTRLAEESGVDLESLETYYTRVALYKDREASRRATPA